MTGASARRPVTIATDTSSPMKRAKVVSSGEKTTAAMGPHTAAATNAHSDGLRRSRYSAAVRMPHPLFCITLVG